jgi:ferredoxin, 2Fe-2S
MPTVTWISPKGPTYAREVEVGDSLMDAAVFGGISEVEGACGGCLSCATCHVYIDNAFVDRFGPPEADELSMLEMVSSERRPESRLSCQLRMRQDLDGLVLHLPESQG